MTNIEKLAQTKFEKYCEQEGGTRGDWRYLSKRRQLVWMEEVLDTVEMVIKSMQQTVKPMPPPSRFDTIWLQGHHAGQVSERTGFIEYLQKVLDEGKQEVSEFKGNIQDE